MTLKTPMTIRSTLCALTAVGVALLALPAAAQGPVGGAPIFGAPEPGTPNLSGKWINATPTIALKTTAGAPPPLTAKGKAEYAAHKANKKADPINDCLLQGEPRLLFTQYPFLILQYAKHVDFVHEVNHTFRITYFGDTLDPESDPQWLGHPTARWEGKTLVIDSINYNNETWLDYSGLPHSDKMKTQERYTLSADGQTIAARFTIDDPEDYTRPWTTAFTLKKRPGYDLVQTSCMADHRM